MYNLKAIRCWDDFFVVAQSFEVTIGHEILGAGCGPDSSRLMDTPCSVGSNRKGLFPEPFPSFHAIISISNTAKCETSKFRMLPAVIRQTSAEWQ